MEVRQDLSQSKERDYRKVRLAAWDALMVAKEALEVVEELVDVEALEDQHLPVILKPAQDAVEKLRRVYQHAHYVVNPEDQYDYSMIDLGLVDKPIIDEYPQQLNAIYQI